MKNNFINKVASGLRKMKNPPDAFLFVSNNEYIYDKKTILTIPVYHSAFIFNSMMDEDIPFIPLWYAEADYIIDRKIFNTNYLLGGE